MKNSIKIVCFAMALLPLTMNAQQVTLGGLFGYANPQGKAFTNSVTGEKMTKLGLDLDFDLLYHLPQFNNQLAVGITWNTAFLFGASAGGGTLDIGMYGQALYGVKGHYKFFKSKVSPYAALSLGLSQLSTPEITSGNTVIAEAHSGYTIGVRPEIGVQFGGFVISAGYLVPMKHKVDGVKLSAGSLQISLGARAKLWGESNNASHYNSRRY